MNTTPQKSSGVALITALLLIALITVSVTSMSVRQNATIQRAANRQVKSQLHNLLGAGEKFAMAVLRRDRVEGERNNSDSTEDYWAESLPPVPVDGATVEGCVIDLQGKFNLNNLVNDEGTVEDLAFQQLQRLLRALNIEGAKASAIRDWIDPDIDSTGSEGAEDDFYTSQAPPYRAANGYMVSPTELQLVRGFRVTDEGGLEDYDLLLPHISTLPYGTLVNINTASEAVLASLADYMSGIADQLIVADDGYWQSFPDCPEGGGLLDTLINSSGSGSGAAAGSGAGTSGAPGNATLASLIYENIESFKASARGSKPDENIDDADIGVVSRYYLSRVTVSRDQASITQYTVMERDNTGAISVKQRTRNAY